MRRKVDLMFTIWIASVMAFVAVTMTCVEKVDYYIPEAVYAEAIEPADIEERFTDEEVILIARVVKAEAENQDNIGKRLVVDVILNRVESELFPNSVREVVYQENQFATPAGTYSKEDIELVRMEIEQRIDTDVIYFRTNHFHSFGTKLYQHGDHYFSGR